MFCELCLYLYRHISHLFLCLVWEIMERSFQTGLGTNFLPLLCNTDYCSLLVCLFGVGGTDRMHSFYCFNTHSLSCASEGRVEHKYRRLS